MIKYELFLTICNCGFITPHIASKYFKITKKTLDIYSNKDFLYKKSVILFGKNSSIYILSDTLANSLREKGYCIYKHDTTQLEHDYLLLKVYLSLKKNEQLSWQNETALKTKFGKDIDTCDAIYVRENKLIGVEIFTPEYRSNKKNDKINFMKKYCDNYVTFNTKDFDRR